MTHSILYMCPEKTSLFSLDQELLKHLLIDDSFSYICHDVKQRNFFLNIVMHPCTDKDEIVYRQQILDDFKRNAGLFDKLHSLWERFDELYQMQKSTRQRKIQNILNCTESIATARNLLQTNALALKRGLLFIAALAEILSKANLHSKGLLNLLNVLNIYRNNHEMIRLCENFENFSTAGSIDIKITIDDGKIRDCKLVEHKYIHFTDPDISQKRMFSFNRKSQPVYPSVRLFPQKGDNYEKLIITAIMELTDIFSCFFLQLCDLFMPVYEELTFYKIALKYIEYMDEKGIQLSFPQFVVKEKPINVKCLYDLYLIAALPDVKKAVPNDLSLPPDKIGVLLLGDNGSGKTVYLRSIATMHILAQSGLPVPAKFASIPLYNQIATQFAESEIKIGEMNDMGRFEQEVQKLARIVNCLKPNALVLLNETFQSTAYNEGTDALYNLLEYFTSQGVRWILVTHLKQFEQEYKSAHNVNLLYTSGKYRIVSSLDKQLME